jgi:Kdo2-lipid IVA lauroyltransferase/acyltransferase
MMTKAIHYIAYLLFRLFTLFFSILPATILYLLADLLAFLFYNFGYRKKIVIDNLTQSFPQKSKNEINLIAKKSYKNFADIVIEGIHGLEANPQSLSQKFHFKNTDFLIQNCNKEGNSIILGAHYANWEWGVIVFPMKVPVSVYGLYKPLSNHFIEKYVSAKREKEGMHLVSIYGGTQFLSDSKFQNASIVYLTDQNPSNVSKAHWVEFLNRETACLYGADDLARNKDFPVFFIKIAREKRGHYSLEFELLTTNPAALKEGEITKLFMNRLEQIILDNPSDWLWTHKRWKHKRNTFS